MTDGLEEIEFLIVHQLRMAHDYPEGYLSTTTQMELMDNGGRMIVAYATRCGITRPGYKDRATYRIRWSGEEEPTPGIYVYDAGKLTEVNDWHADVDNLKSWTPAPATPPKGKGKRKR